MKVNYHTHTPRCRHALGVDQDYIDAAIQAGMDVLGFSDHGPFPDKDYGCRMLYDELEEYLESISSYKKIYKDKLTIYTGLEIEYLPEYHSYYEKLLADSRIDYLLLAGHFFHSSKSEEMPNIFFAPDTESYIDYAKNLVAGMKTGYFSMIAHPDLMFINSFPWDDNCTKASDIIIDAAAANKWLLEYNANGIRREIKEFPDGPRYPYPHPRFWDMAKEAKVTALVGSDCHDPKQVWDYAVSQSIEEVTQLGLPVKLNIFE